MTTLSARIETTAAHAAGIRVQRANAPASRRAFSLIDLLVSIVIIALLMAITLPVLTHATEASRRVACRSNVRQMGIALALYAEDNDGQLPRSEFAAGNTPDTFRPQQMMLLHAGKGPGDWDGLGWLYAGEYLRTPTLFYCPSHRGEHSFDNYEVAWLNNAVSIVGNYHFRAIIGQTYLTDLAPSTALISDGMRTVSDFNHLIGANVLLADLSVTWAQDPNSEIRNSLPRAESDATAAEAVARAWHILEDGDDSRFPGLPWRPNTPTGPETPQGFGTW